MSVESIVAFIVGLVVGLLVAWFYWRQRISEHEARVQLLQTAVNEREQNLKSLRGSLDQQEAQVERLKSQVDQKEMVIRDLNARLDWRKVTINQLGDEMIQRDDRLSQSEETIRDLTAQVRKRNEALHELQKTVGERADEFPATPSAATQPAKASTGVAEPAATTAPPDNLKRIEGIGPKISTLLNSAGITTFAELAETDVRRLHQILEEAGPRYQLANPETWPEQARLAAGGDWTALNALQEELRGGRRAAP